MMQTEIKKEKRIIKEFHENSREVSEELVQRNQTSEIQTQKNISIFIPKSKVQQEIKPITITNYKLVKGLNRQVVANAVTKNQIFDQSLLQHMKITKQRQNHHNRKAYYYVAPKKNYIRRPMVLSSLNRLSNVHSVDSPKRIFIYFKPLEIDINCYPKRVYASRSPICRRCNKSIQNNYYYAEGPGRVIKFGNRKYTSQNEINKIILIQRWWRYILGVIDAKRVKEIIGSERTNVNESINIKDYMIETESKEEINEKIIRTENEQNIREKIINGGNKKLLLTTTKIEVFGRKNVILKKVDPEKLVKEVKKIKKTKSEVNEKSTSINIKKEMSKIWIRECQEISETSFDCLSVQKEKISTIKNEIIEEYESQFKKLKLLLAKKEEEILKLTNNLKNQNIIKNFENLDFDYRNSLNILSEKVPWNDLITPKKTEKISFKGVKKNNLPFTKKLGNEKKITKKLHSDNEIQNTEKIEILKLQKPENEIEYIDSIELIYSKSENELFIEKANDITISYHPEKKLEKEIIEKQIPIKWENVPENVNEINIKGRIRPENEIQSIDSIKLTHKRVWQIEEEKMCELTIENKESLKKEKIENEIQSDIELTLLSNPKPQNEIQNLDKFELLKLPRPENEIQIVNEIEILKASRPENVIQTVNEIEITKISKPENEIESLEGFELLNVPKPENMAESLEGFELLSKEKQPLSVEYCDILSITVSPKLKNIPKQEEVCQRDSFEILPKLKEPLQLENVDDIMIERYKRTENVIQIIDQMEILRKEKAENEIERIELTILRAEKLENQIQSIDSIELTHKRVWTTEEEKMWELTIEKILKPENKIQTGDVLTILRKVKPENEIQACEAFELLKKQRPENNIESLEGFELLKAAKPINEIEYNEPIELIGIPNIWTTEIDNIDYIYIPGKERPENEIQSINQMEILKTPKPENIIEEGIEIEILKKEKEPLEIEYCDIINIEVEPKLKGKKPLLITEKNSIEILSKPKEPLQSENIDDLFITGKVRPENEIQIVDKMEILRKEKPQNEIESIDSIELTFKKVWKIVDEKTTELTILKIEKPENEIQRDELTILRKEKPENEIQSINSIKLTYKKVWEAQPDKIDEITILPLEKPKNKIELIGKFSIKGKRFGWKDLITQNECCLIMQSAPKPKNEIEFVDELEILKKQRPENNIETLEGFELLKAAKPINEIEYNEPIELIGIPNIWTTEIDNIDYIYIPGKERPENEIQTIEGIEILRIKRPENEIQSINQMEILKTPKPENIIEEGIEIEILKKEKEPLEIEYLETIEFEPIKGINPMFISDSCSIQILPLPKSPLQRENIDSIFIRSKEKTENKIETIDSIELTYHRIWETQIDKLDDIIICPVEEDPLYKQKSNELFIKGIPFKLEWKDLMFENQSQCEIKMLKAAKPINEIEYNEPIELIGIPNIWTTEIDNIDYIYIPGKERPENEIQSINQMEILKSPKPENIIEEGIEIEILKKEKKPLIIQLCYIMSIINTKKYTASPPKEETLTTEKCSFELLSNPKETLHEIQNIDQIEILKIPKQENEIEYIDSIELHYHNKKQVDLYPENQQEILYEPVIKISTKLPAEDFNKPINVKKGKPINIEEQTCSFNIKNYKPITKNYPEKIPDLTILSKEKENPVLQNIDDLYLPASYDMLYMRPSWSSLDVQALGGLNLLVNSLDLGLERQEISNIQKTGLKNKTNDWNLLITPEAVDEFKIIDPKVENEEVELLVEVLDNFEICANNKTKLYKLVEIPENEMEHLDDINISGEHSREFDEELYMEKIDNWFVVSEKLIGEESMSSVESLFVENMDDFVIEREYETRASHVVKEREENDVENAAFSNRQEYQRQIIINETETNEEYNRRILQNGQEYQQIILSRDWNDKNLKCQAAQFKIDKSKNYSINNTTSWNEFIVPQVNFTCNIEPELKQAEDYDKEAFSITIFGNVLKEINREENEKSLMNRTSRNWNNKNQPIRNTMITFYKSKTLQNTNETTPPKIIYERNDWNKVTKIRKENNINLSTPKKKRSLSKQENQSMSILGDKQKWNKNNKAQKIAKLLVEGEKVPWELKMQKLDEIIINKEPNAEEIINYNDHNRIEEKSLKRTIKAIIRKVHNEYESDEPEDIDPLESLKKHHKSKKYDKYFQLTYNRPKTKGDIKIEKQDYDRLSDDEKYKIIKNIEVEESNIKKEYISPRNQIPNIPRVERVKKFDNVPQKREKIVITSIKDDNIDRRRVSRQEDIEQGQMAQRYEKTHQAIRRISNSQEIGSRGDIEKILHKKGSRHTSREKKIEYLRDTNDVNNNQYII